MIKDTHNRREGSPEAMQIFNILHDVVMATHHTGVVIVNTTTYT